MNRRAFMISGVTLLLPTASHASDTIGGRYAANGKDVKLAFVSAYVTDGMSGKPAVVIVMTEKDHSASKRPTWDADFGKFGSALTISLHREDGRIYGCQVGHQGLKRSPVSSIGTVKAEGLKLEGDRVKVRITSGGPMKIFDEQVDIDLQVDAAIRPKLA